MAAGDFLDVYNDAEYVASLDVVVTCFFMDCAHNILDFMQTIHRVSKHTFLIRSELVK
jgi:carnosine N-methyltransferase